MLLYIRDCLCDYILLCIFHTEDCELMFKYVLCCRRIMWYLCAIFNSYLICLFCKMLMPQSGIWFSKSQFYCMVLHFTTWISGADYTILVNEICSYMISVVNILWFQSPHPNQFTFCDSDYTRDPLARLYNTTFFILKRLKSQEAFWDSNSNIWKWIRQMQSHLMMQQLVYITTADNHKCK